MVCTVALAQTAPSAGSLSRQLEASPPQPPAASAPAIRVEQVTTPAAAAPGHAIALRQLRVNGARVYSQATLLALAGWDGPAELTLGQLRSMAANISTHYRKNGYFLAQAYLPAQDIVDGVATIVVLEGQYGQISVRNSAGISDGLIRGLLDGLANGDAVAIAPLERRMLLLADVAGVTVKSTLVPGASIGASDLIVEVAPGPLVTGNLDADNQGNRYTGANRFGANVQINNPTGAGDVISARAMTSFDGLRYGRLAYQLPLGRFTAGAAYSRMNYRLGQEFASLQASGVATITSLYGSYPLLRSRSHNLNVQLHLDDKGFTDRAGATATLADKQARVGMLSLTGEQRDASGGATSYAASFSRGRIDLRSAAARAADAASVRTDGSYSKLVLSASRQQALSDSVSLYAAINGQLASNNLDVSEKMGLGGDGAVRAYPAGESYGDQGYVLNLEARALLPSWPADLPGRLLASAFVDHGRVTLNKQAWHAGPTARSLSGIGLGLSWTAPGDFLLSTTVATRLGNAVATSAPDRGARLGLRGIKYF